MAPKGQRPPSKGCLAAKRSRTATAAASGAADDGVPDRDGSSCGSGVAGKSCLAKCLLFFWSWGFMSLVFVQKIAAAAAEDFAAQGCSAPGDLAMLAKLGTGGGYISTRNDVLKT
jgi:hypothetical protein